MLLHTKFNIGDTIYFKSYKMGSHKEKCSYCKGTGKLVLVNKDILVCNKCDGRKYIETHGAQEYFAKGIVNDIQITKESKNIIITYCIRVKINRCNRYYWVTEDKAFSFAEL